MARYTRATLKLAAIPLDKDPLRLGGGVLVILMVYDGGGSHVHTEGNNAHRF